MEDSSFRYRTLLILLLLSLWGVLSIFQLYACVIKDREKMLAKCAEFAWKTAVVPGKRGAICDRNGTILAHNILEYSILLTHLPKTPVRRRRLLKRLQKDFPSFQQFPPAGKFPHTLKKGLTAKEIALYSEKYHFWQEVTIRSKMKRICLYPALDTLIGRTAFNDQGEMAGISGLEKELDALLAGRSGTYQVMVDRFGVWYPESLRILRKPRHGKNVKTDFLLEERLSRGKGESL